MKIRVMSDIHTEFDRPGESPDPGTGDILVLAGDICCAALWNEDVEEFFNKAVAGYNRVLYVMGNHEGYHSNVQKAREILIQKLPRGVSLMDNRSEFIDGVHFIGATLWTNFNNMDPETIETARSCMNDYHAADQQPEDTLEEHLITRNWFERCIPTLRGPVFVITHHAPSPKSVKGRYTGSEGMYSTDLESFIAKHDNILWWCHGHVHECSDYKVKQCRVICNPRGYNHSELNPAFELAHEIEIPESLCYTKHVSDRS